MGVRTLWRSKSVPGRFGRLKPITYSVDAIRNTLVPALAVLVGLNRLFGVAAVCVLRRVSSVDAG
ncbi:hypothetical protein BRC96_04700 [Halobacteriales archaeon QS_6_64_34]|nr:MAG: hypothetical protein BRC96_04700 [Halobacteriales archaeon QS_6_64_34]